MVVTLMCDVHVVKQNSLIFVFLSGCPLVDQVTSLCTSSCPRDCFRSGNESCVQLCDACACAPPAIADYITGKCVQPEQCTGKPTTLTIYTCY